MNELNVGVVAMDDWSEFQKEIVDGKKEWWKVFDDARGTLDV